jgi:hypothetical protein
VSVPAFKMIHVKDMDMNMNTLLVFRSPMNFEVSQ